MPIRTRKLKNGKIVFDVRAEYGGVRVERTVPTTITEARRVESRMLHDLIHGRFDILKKRQNPLFREYAEDYKISVTWQKSYERTCYSLKPLMKFFGGKKLTEITVSDFIRYRTERLKKVKPATINREYACLKRMLNLAAKSEDYILKRNPLGDIEAMKEAPVQDRTLTVEEYHRLLEVAPEYFRRIIRFACNTAMRRTEIFSLQFFQVKFWPSGMEVELTDTKSGELETVPLNQDTREWILEIADERGINLHKMLYKKKCSTSFWEGTEKG